MTSVLKLVIDLFQSVTEECKYGASTQIKYTQYSFHFAFYESDQAHHFRKVLLYFRSLSLAQKGAPWYFRCACKTRYTHFFKNMILTPAESACHSAPVPNTP